MKTTKVKLCKWWKTPSAKRAFARVKKANKERMKVVREAAQKKRKEKAALEKRVAAYHS